MRDLADRIRLVKERARALRDKREKRFLWALTALSLMLSLALFQVLAGVTGDQRGASVQDMLGATLLYEDAGAYVLVGLVSFFLAVTITALCLRHRYKGVLSEKARNQASDLPSSEEEKKEDY
ncbi:MAG TPA: hypothetical protein VFD14_05190 [Clostridia bacterium]|nr:hypothetical protein [Clostridia bacterium]